MQLLDCSKIIGSTLALVILGFFAPTAFGADQQFFVYFGTYTGAKSKGIYVCRFNSATGKLGTPELAAESASPSFLAIHPNKRFLYAVNEASNSQGKPTGAVSAFAIEQSTGKLTPLNQQPSSGDGPCHLVVDAPGKHVLVANYGSGSTAVLALQNDGRLGESTAFIQHRGSSVNKQRQEGPHAHCVTLDGNNRQAFVCDLGLDKILVFQYDTARGTLVANDPPAVAVKPGAGPRHFAFDPKSRHGYVINEIDCTLTAFSYDSRRGVLIPIQTLSTLPSGESVRPEYSTAEVQVHRSGKFLYGSNRGHNTIVVFRIDQKRGELTPVQHQSTEGKTPRHFALDPTGRWLIAENQDSDSVVVFQIDQQTGRLTPTGQSITVGAPVCAQFVAVR